MKHRKLNEFSHEGTKDTRSTRRRAQTASCIFFVPFVLFVATFFSLLAFLTSHADRFQAPFQSPGRVR